MTPRALHKTVCSCVMILKSTIFFLLMASRTGATENNRSVSSRFPQGTETSCSHGKWVGQIDHVESGNLADEILSRHTIAKNGGGVYWAGVEEAGRELSFVSPVGVTCSLFSL